ncbi:MAG: hypothetical protein FWF85_05305 [Clostridiales bacterium]|nr:hypothetical protein [Clostridiales bacterium]
MQQIAKNASIGLFSALLALNSETTFSIIPKIGLNAGSYAATLIVSSKRYSVIESLEINFMVDPSGYDILSKAPNLYTFFDTLSGHNARTALAFKVINTDNQAKGTLTVALNGEKTAGSASLEPQPSFASQEPA